MKWAFAPSVVETGPEWTTKRWTLTVSGPSGTAPIVESRGVSIIHSLMMDIPTRVKCMMLMERSVLIYDQVLYDGWTACER